jgi:serine/threonine protein phosphatase PrpC
MAWRWVSATCRGSSHVRSGEPLQDTAHGWRGGNDNAVFVGVVSDGAGSAKYSKAGSALACRIFLQEVRSAIWFSSGLPSTDQLSSVVDRARDGIFAVATRRGLTMRDFACTLVAVIANESEALTIHVGDGAVVGLDTDGALKTLSAPDHGEYVSTTYFLTDDSSSGARVRFQRHSRRYRAIALMSDGLERLALSMHDYTPFEPFFTGIFNPVRSSSARGYDDHLSAQLSKYLDSERVNARTDDDKSLVIACRL